MNTSFSERGCEDIVGVDLNVHLDVGAYPGMCVGRYLLVFVI